MKKSILKIACFSHTGPKVFIQIHGDGCRWVSTNADEICLCMLMELNADECQQLHLDVCGRSWQQMSTNLTNTDGCR